MVYYTAMQYAGPNVAVTWPNLGYPIVDDINTGVQHGAHLTIAAGTTVDFGKGDALLVAASTLTAEGTKDQRVVLTSDSPTPVPGSWPGLTIARYSDVSLRFADVR